MKKIWSFQDNLTKIIGKHTFKAGFFGDENHQLPTTGTATGRRAVEVALKYNF